MHVLNHNHSCVLTVKRNEYVRIVCVNAEVKYSTI